MKNILKQFLLLTLVVFTISSCSDFLEEDLSAQLTPEGGGLGTLDGLKAALVGSYAPLSRTWVSGLGNASTQAILMGSDDLTTHKASNKADFREFDQFKVSQQNGRLPFVWSGAYKSIQGCNNIITNYEAAIGDQTAINHIAGEAFFLRAYNYFWIVRLWGKAPLMLSSQVFDESTLSINSASTEELYAQIISDLDQAVGLLGNVRPETARVNKGAALAILSEVYLQMTGWPLKDQSKFALAASTAKQVIDNQDIYGMGLLDNFIDLWPSPTMNNDGHKENVFSLTFSGVQWYNGNAAHGNATIPSDIGGWDDYFTELTFFNTYPDQLRKDITFQTEAVKADGTVLNYLDFETGRPYFKKLQGTKQDWNNALSMQLERLAEVYFNYAEAQIMATGNNSDASALEAVNKIVRRAHGLPIDTPDATVDYTSLTQRQIIQEKAWEFAGEYCRWFDLTRLEMVEEVNALKDPSELQPLGPIQYYLPLPASETLVNGNL